MVYRPVYCEKCGVHTLTQMTVLQARELDKLGPVGNQRAHQYHINLIAWACSIQHPGPSYAVASSWFIPRANESS